MQAAEMKFFPGTKKLKKWDWIRNKVIRQRVGVQSTEEIRKRRLEWYGHVKKNESVQTVKNSPRNENN
jgi:hypothetical protein